MSDNVEELTEFLEKIDNDYTNFRFLPSDDKLLKLGTCDFHLTEGDGSKYQIQCGLKDIFNPILILFYYNNTPDNILSDFYEASRTDEKLEEGKIKDSMTNKRLKEEDLVFKFGAINLNYETDLKDNFTTPNIKLGNPFKWMEIVPGENYPFLAFYYQGIPQSIYEGVVKSDLIINEFKNWYSNLEEQEQDERENLYKKFKDGTYSAVHNGSINYMDQTNISRRFDYLKGDLFNVTFTDRGVIFANLAGGEDMMIEYNETEAPALSKFNQEIFSIRFRKTEVTKQKEKEVFIDHDFLTQNDSESKEFKKLFDEHGVEKDLIPETEIDTETKKKKDIEQEIKGKEEIRNEVKVLTYDTIKFLSEMRNRLAVFDVFSV